MSRNSRIALLVLGAGLLFRAWMCFGFVPAWEARGGYPPAPDSYPTLARTLLDEGTLGYGPEGATPTTVRAPGFPAWLAAGMLLGGGAPPWTGFWGGLPGLLVAAWIAFELSRRFGAFAGMAGGGIAALHPLSALISARSMADEFTGALGMAGLLAWAHALRGREASRAWLWTGAAGLLLAVHGVTRVSGPLTIACAIGFGLLRAPRRFSLLLTLGLLSLAPAAAWSVRSSLLEGEPVLVNALGPFNFWVGEEFDTFTRETKAGVAWEKVYSSVLSRAGLHERAGKPFDYKRLTPREAADLDRRLARAAAERIVSSPLSYAARVARGIGRFWYQAQTGRGSLRYLGITLPLLVLGLLGARRLLRSGGEEAAFAGLLVSVILLHNLMHAATLAMARLSVQVYPELAWLAGVGALALVPRRAAPPGRGGPETS